MTIPIKKVLVVDDEEMYLDLIRDLLQINKFQVEVAKTPHDARQLYEKFQPDLLVSDWLLKDEMTGHDLAKELLERKNDLKVVIVSGLPSIKLEESEWIKLLKKPFRQAELLEVIQSYSAA